MESESARRERHSRARALAHGALALSAILFGCQSEPPPLPPSLYEDAELAELVDANDGVDGTAPRLGGFVNGGPTRYWHLGLRSAQPMIAYRLCAEDEDGECAAIDHPMVVDRVPGEEGYSPYLHVHRVEVPPGYAGRLRSFAEVEASGFSAEPTGRYVHCPIASEDARIEVGPGASVLAEERIWVRGLEARCFAIGGGRERALLSDGTMIVRNVYVLSREGESAPLMELARMEDLTGDGDQVDSNNIFGVSLSDGAYTPLWRMVTVRVPADYASIDTHMDETMADFRSAADLFDVLPDYSLVPIEGNVLDYEVTETLVDCPLQGVEGRL